MSKCWFRFLRIVLAVQKQIYLDQFVVDDGKAVYPPSNKEIQPSSKTIICVDVFCELSRYFDQIAKATAQGNLRLGTFNFEYLTREKAEKFLPAYINLIEKHHLLLCVEVEEQGLKYLAEKCGYEYRVSKGNVRNQAVGMLIHPRLRLTETLELKSVASIPGTQHMRPALVAQVEDQSNSLKFAEAVVHLKSLRGGQKRTSVIRRQQIEALVLGLGENYQGIVGGDFNCFLDNTDDTCRLLESGFRLVYPGDTAATQSMGGRLDGIFYSARLGSVAHLSHYQVRSFWRNSKIGKSFSDHSLVSVDLRKKQRWL